jgi:uncharacterized protein YqeY
MDVPDKLIEDMKTAMKSGDKVRLETIRGLRSQMKNAEIDKGRSLTEDEVIQNVNANSPSDMGKVMGAIMPQLKGRADGKLVQKIVQHKLSTL